MRGAALLIILLGCGGGGGGGDGDGTPDGAPAADGRASRWSSAPPIEGGPIQETAAVAVAGRVYVIGGLTSFSAFSRAVWVYDVAARSWAAGPALPRPLHHANAAVVDGTIYLLGALEGPGFTATGEVWSFQPGVDPGWQARGTMPAGTQRGSAAVAVIGDRVYLAGGFRAGAAVADVSSYQPSSGAWDTVHPPLPAPRDHGCGAAIDGTVYVAGGRQGAIASRSDQVFAYAPGDMWRERTPMPTARGGIACGAIGDRLIVVGGEGNAAAASGVFAQTEIYDASGNAWTTDEPMPVPRHGMGAAVWDGALYVPAGATQEAIGPVATHEVYRP